MSLDISKPFTRQEALAAGLTDEQLRGDEFVKVIGAVFVVSTLVGRTPQVRAGAALLVHPDGAIASHATVARLLGAPIPHDPLEHITVNHPDLDVHDMA